MPCLQIPSNPMRAVVLVLLPLLLALAVGSGVPQLNDPAEDYLFLTENDPNRVEQAQQVAARKAGVAYGDMKDAGATTFVTNYAVNITIPIANPALPTSPVGTYVQQMSVAELTVDVLLTTAKYAASATAASLLPQPVTLDGYTKFYDSYPHLPIGLQSPGAWRTDAFFGQLFLTYFPTTLLRTDASVLDNLGSLVPTTSITKWTKWAAKGRLLHVNHTQLIVDSNLDTIKPGISICPRLVLFHSERVGGKDVLTPLGILMRNEWMTPSGSEAWLLSKLSALQTEALVQPMNHFHITHVLLAPILLAMLRNMGTNHPFYNLVIHTFDYDWGLLVRGGTGLFNVGTNYDKITATGAIGMHTYQNAWWGKRKWTDHYIENDLARRGVANLAGYLFAEDMLASNAYLHDFADTELRTYYVNDAAIVNDAALQATFAEAGDPKFGKLYGLPVLDSIEALVDVATHILTCVFRHAATNYAAYGDVQQVLPYAVPHLNCSWPETDAATIVTESWIVQNCMPNVALSVATIQNAVAFNRTFPVSYMMRHLPQSIRAGTRVDKARRQMADAMTRQDKVIQARDDPILPYQIFLSTRVPRAGAV